MPALKAFRLALPLVLVGALVLVGMHPVGAADPSQIGQWSTMHPLGIVGVHGAVLHTGKVLLYSGTENESAGSVARLLDPVTNQVTKVSIPYKHPAFCSGVTVMPDGRVLVMGGQVDLQIGHGVRDVSIFDPESETWTRGPYMQYARYYPSVIELPDGRALVIAGTDANGQNEISQLEVYDSVAGTWSTLPSSANQISPTYPRLALLPSEKIARVSELPMTRLFDPATNTWSNVAQLKYGKRYTASHVLLPGLTKVLVAGGTNSVLATNTAEVIDFAAATPAWKYTGAMHKARDNLNLVLLADGTVLAVGGGRNTAYGTPQRDAELYDPATGRWKLMASQHAQRTYHSTAFLLPDGRVLSAGSDFGTNENTYEIYSPPYLFRGPRPTIASAPDSLTYGQTFVVDTPDAAGITRVALIRPGATTHADDFDQRYVDLAFSTGTGSIQAVAPGTGAEAPPGWYMLFIVNAAGVPSISTFVHLA
jgi:WD40 repeat protein